MSTEINLDKLTNDLTESVWHIKTDGTMQKVTPKNGEYFVLEELQAYVGGYIELVCISDDIWMYCNEEGRLEDLPVNHLVSPIAYLATGMDIRGDVILGPASVLQKDGEDS